MYQMEGCLLSREENDTWLMGRSVCEYYVGLRYWPIVDLEHNHQPQDHTPWEDSEMSHLRFFLV